MQPIDYVVVAGVVFLVLIGVHVLPERRAS